MPAHLTMSAFHPGEVALFIETMAEERREVLYKRCSHEFDARLRARELNRPYLIGAYVIGIAQGAQKDGTWMPRYFFFKEKNEPESGLEFNAAMNGRFPINGHISDSVFFKTELEKLNLFT